MSKYTQLTKEDRIEIASLLKSGKVNQTEIALQIGKNKSTISRELSRNQDLTTSICSSGSICSGSGGSGKYNYSIAHKLAKERKTKANQLRIKIVLNGEIEEYILEKLKLHWSPDEISGRLPIDQPSTEKQKIPSHQTIYDHIYLNRPEWKSYLRIIGVKGKYRRKYGTKIREKLREESKKKRIDTRPEIINNRSRLGDWEGDTIVGGEKIIHILTHVDRKSGYLIANKAKDITKEGIQKLTLNSFQKLPKTKVNSITYDNGVQFEKHQDTEQKLQNQANNPDFAIYFAYPYHSWERGTNENTNGLLRYFYPKKTLFKNITQKELDKKVKLLNRRPRKRLNYLTPEEVFRGHSLESILKSLEKHPVALRS